MRQLPGSPHRGHPEVQLGACLAGRAEPSLSRAALFPCTWGIGLFRVVRIRRSETLCPSGDTPCPPVSGHHGYVHHMSHADVPVGRYVGRAGGALSGVSAAWEAARPFAPLHPEPRKTLVFSALGLWMAIAGLQGGRGSGPALPVPLVVCPSASSRALRPARWLRAREAGPTPAERCRDGLSRGHLPSAILTAWEGRVCTVCAFPAQGQTCFSGSLASALARFSSASHTASPGQVQMLQIQHVVHVIPS